jgi:hypothetical protein
MLLIRVLFAAQVGPALDKARLDRGPQEPISVSMLMGHAVMDNGVFTCEGLPQWPCARLERRLSAPPKEVAAGIKQAGDRDRTYAFHEVHNRRVSAGSCLRSS